MGTHADSHGDSSEAGRGAPARCELVWLGAAAMCEQVGLGAAASGELVWLGDAATCDDLVGRGAAATCDVEVEAIAASWASAQRTGAEATTVVAPPGHPHSTRDASVSLVGQSTCSFVGRAGVRVRPYDRRAWHVGRVESPSHASSVSRVWCPAGMQAPGGLSSTLPLLPARVGSRPRVGRAERRCNVHAMYEDLHYCKGRCPELPRPRAQERKRVVVIIPHPHRHATFLLNGPYHARLTLRFHTRAAWLPRAFSLG